MEKQLIVRFLQKKCTPEEAKAVIDWMNSDDYKPELMRRIEEDLLSYGKDIPYEKDLDVILQDIFIQEESHRLDVPVHSTYRKQESQYWSNNRYLMVAASIMVIFFSGFLVYNSFKPVDPVQFTQPSTHVVKENGSGRKSTIFLPDGSMVNLNSESSIEYPENFSENERVVTLSGEAFFQITRDTLRPFRVICDRLMVTALGTSFHVSSYNSAEQITVALASGRVLVEKDQAEQILLEPGKMIRYDKEAGIFSGLEIFDPRYIYGWKDGLLSFKSADFATVMTALQRWYGLNFYFEGQPAEAWSYTGEFDDQSLKSVMESLSFSQDFEYKIENKKVYIKFKKDAYAPKK